jgi:hypothetical protein
MKNKKTTKTKGGFIVASLTFSYSPLQCGDFFFPSKEKLLTYGSLGIMDLFGDIFVYSIYL